MHHVFNKEFFNMSKGTGERIKRKMDKMICKNVLNAYMSIVLFTFFAYRYLRGILMNTFPLVKMQ